VVFLVTYGSDLVSRDTDHVIFAGIHVSQFPASVREVTSGFNGRSLLARKLRICYCVDRRHSLMAKDCGVPVTVLHNNSRSRLDLLRRMSRHSRNSQQYHVSALPQLPVASLADKQPPTPSCQCRTVHSTAYGGTAHVTRSDTGPYHL